MEPIVSKSGLVIVAVVDGHEFGVDPDETIDFERIAEAVAPYLAEES